MADRQPAVGHGARITPVERGGVAVMAIAEKEALDAIQRISERLASVQLLKPRLETHFERVQEQARRLNVRG